MTECECDRFPDRALKCSFCIAETMTALPQRTPARKFKDSLNGLNDITYNADILLDQIHDYEQTLIRLATQIPKLSPMHIAQQVLDQYGVPYA